MLRCHARRLLLYLESPSESNPFAPTPSYFFLFLFSFSPVRGQILFFLFSFSRELCEFRVTHETFTWSRLRCLRRTAIYVTEIENLSFSVSLEASNGFRAPVFSSLKKKKEKEEGERKKRRKRTRCSLTKLQRDKTHRSIIGRRPLLILFRKPQIARYTAYLRERLICRN